MLSIETLLASSLDDTPVATQPSASAAEVLNTPGSVQLAAAAEGESQAEGEDAPDLVAFAQALTDAGVKFYGAPWCVHCTEQKELFEDGGKYLPYIDASNPDGTANQIAIDNNITSFPTWVFQDESRLTGAQSLETLSQESGIAIPTSSTPSLAELDDVTVLNGSPLHVALDGYDPNGNAITYTVTSDNPDVVPTVLDGNRSIVIDVDDYGKMVFELFEQRASRPSERVIELAEDDFYDGIIFHRIIEGFVIQGGDPTGTGSGGSSLGDFDDQFHVDLQHNTTGLLSYAKTTDDTNDSQFFITLDPLPGQSYPRHLDFNHSIFGLLTEGQSVLEALSQVPTTSTRPDTSIVMNSVDVFTDDENGVLMLSADGATSGTANITVTATDSEGNSTQQTFQVTVGVDTINGGPFLDDIPELTTTGGVPVEFQLVGNDVEGDAIYYEAAKRGSVDYTFTVDNTTGEVTVTPPADFVGQLQIDVSARALNGSNTSDPLDSQTVTIDVLAAIPELDLLAVSDSNIDDDNITNETTLQFRVSNVTAGATVQILNGTSVIGQGTANGTSIDLATGVLGLQGDGSYTLTAIQIIDGVESDPSEELIVTLDTQAPGDITSTPPTSATNGEQITYDVDSPEEGSSGTRYSLINPPSGASIDPVTGELQWTPTPLQGGVNAFQVQLMDEAGNTTSQDISIDVTVVPQLVQIRFEAQDLGGNVITQIQAGEDFVLVVYADDLRDAGQGVFAAYMDILFDSGLIAPLDGSINDIDFELSYSNGRSGNFDTPGLIDEVGSFGPTTPTGPDEVRLFALDFVATDQGTVEFTGDGAVGIGREILVFGTNTPVAPNEVTYLPTTLEIIAGLEAIDDLFNFDEDSSDNPLDVLANDDNQSGGTLSITEVGSTSNGGSVTIDQQNNQLIYTPAADFFGEDVFTYTISNGSGFSTATVTVQVAPVNDPPTANDDAFTVTEDSTDNFLNVQGNDEIAPDADETLRVIAVDDTGMQGTLSITPNGTGVEYTPAAGFVGTETFTYSVRDRNNDQGLTSEATVTVTVQSENAPVLDNDTATVDEDSVQNEIDVLDGDEPHTDGNVLEIASVTQSANGGTVTIGSDGLIRYTPPSDFTGTDTFTYTVVERDATTDEETGNATATVTVTVNDVNDDPTAVDDTVNVIKNTSETLDVLENDEIFPDTDETLRITEVSTGSEGGTVTISSDGLSIEYTPAAGFEGTETFTYTISDREGEGGLTSQATVTVNVLQYVPRSISGSVNLQYLGLPLGGLQLNLSGTDEFSSAVNLQSATAITGDYAFADLAPGTYQLSHGQLPFLIDSTPSMMIQSALADGDSTDNDFEPLGRHAAYLSIADFLASAPGQSMHSPDHAILAALVPGEAQAWFVTEAGWEDAVDGEIRLSEDGSEITVRTTESDGTVQEGTIAFGNTHVVKVLGRSEDNVLVRIYGGPSDLGMEPVVSGSSSSGGEGEPGSAAAASLAAVSQFVTPSGMTGGEGESVSGLSDVTIGAFAQTQAGTPQARTLAVGSTASEETGDAGDATAAADTSATSESPLTAFLASGLSRAERRDVAVTTGGATTPSAVDAILGDPTESPVWAAAEVDQDDDDDPSVPAEYTDAVDAFWGQDSELI